MTTAVAFTSGLLTMGYAVAALFFLRFWAQTRDRLFAYFAIAFLLLTAQRTLLTMTSLGDVLYVIRLLAFVLIIIAIVDKNRSARGSR